jgi:hypothetical protein
MGSNKEVSVIGRNRGRQRYESAITVELPRQLRELIEKEAFLRQTSYASIVRQALIFYFGSRGLIDIAPKPGASPPGAGYEGAEGQGGLSRGDEPRPIIISKEAGGGGG